MCLDDVLCTNLYKSSVCLSGISYGIHHLQKLNVLGKLESSSSERLRLKIPHKTAFQIVYLLNQSTILEAVNK